ncbi:MAG TPA: phosphoribosyltransferase family protein, partial [Trueperaceae bacterium]|nr:phosphoribosyltransferase family protein [Trueperaceae bacterium]
MALFRDRVDAGEKLARALGALAGQNVVVIGLPRGGVPVAAEVARALGAPLDVLVVRKLGHPRQPELAVGALAQGGFSVRNEGLMAGVSEADFARVLAREQRELERRADAYRGGRPPLDLKGKQAVLVDDGLATG